MAQTSVFVSHNPCRWHRFSSFTLLIYYSTVRYRLGAYAFEPDIRSPFGILISITRSDEINVIEKEIFRLKRTEFIGLAAGGSTGVLLLISAAAKSYGFSANVYSIFLLYDPALLTLTAIWVMAIRGYRGATLSEGEKALAIRPKKKPSQEYP